MCSDVGVAVRMTEKCNGAQRGESDAALRRDWPQTAEDIVNCGMLWSRAAWTRRYTTHNTKHTTAAKNRKRHNVMHTQKDT